MLPYIIIVTYNGAPWIRPLLASLRESDHPYVAVVVDNASQDGTPTIVRNEFPEAVLLAQTENGGFGRGNNIGINYAAQQGAEYLFLLNQDALVTPTALGQLCRFLDVHPEFAAVTPNHCAPGLDALDLRTQRGYLQQFAQGYLSDACLGRVRDYYPIYGINAAAWLLRLDALRRAGGFDPLFFMYGEDNDLLNRLHFHGQAFALLPSSRIVHLRARMPQAPVPWWRRLWQISTRARAELLVDLKHPHGRAAGKLLRLLGAGLVTPLARAMSNHDGREMAAYWLGTLRLLAELPSVLRHAALCRNPGAHFLDLPAECPPHTAAASPHRQAAPDEKPAPTWPDGPAAPH
jgi:GT2 family glycosyltransferase